MKLYIYSHECGHQFEGPDETKADLFAIRRGVKWGWLDAVGMEDICTFISTLKGDSVHPPGPQRCETMRNYYNELFESGDDAVGERASPAAAEPEAQGAGPGAPIGASRSLVMAGLVHTRLGTSIVIRHDT